MTTQVKLTFHSSNSPVQVFLVGGWLSPTWCLRDADFFSVVTLPIGPLFPPHPSDKWGKRRGKTHLLLQCSDTHHFCLYSIGENPTKCQRAGNTISGQAATSWQLFYTSANKIPRERLSVSAVTHVLPPTCAAWIPAHSLIQVIWTNLMWPFKIHLKLCIIQRALECLLSILV